MKQREMSKEARMREPVTLTDAIELSSEKRESIPGVLLGTLIGRDERGALVVDLPYAGFREPVLACSIAILTPDSIGRRVAVVFEQGDPSKPLVIGLVQDAAFPVGPDRPAPEVTLDGERLVFSAEREIVLRCGKSSVTLTKEGKVVIRGEHLVSRSSGVNRIRGGSIHLN
jgi:hypothetical protein